MISSEANVVFFPPGSLLRAAQGVGGRGSVDLRAAAPGGRCRMVHLPSMFCAQQPLIIHHSPTAKHRGGGSALDRLIWNLYLLTNKSLKSTK